MDDAIRSVLLDAAANQQRLAEQQAKQLEQLREIRRRLVQISDQHRRGLIDGDGI